MTAEKKISVIVPCYNASKWLPQCFLTLVQQSIGIENLELIFVNDASTDGGQTWELLTEFERTFPESILIIDLEQNCRQGGARNEALKYATGEYIAFVDADDWVELDLFEKVYCRAKDTDADIVQFNHKYFVAGIGVLDNQKTMLDEEFCINSIEKRKKFIISEKITYGCWNKIYRRELVVQAGVHYAEGVVYEEPLFVYPLLYYGTKFVIMKECLYIYRQNNNGTMYNDMKDRKTLLQHADVQLKVWEFMKKTVFFSQYYEEIKMYFLHTYLYETLFFAKRRGMEISMDMFKELEEVILREVKDYDYCEYESIIPRQMKLYRWIRQGMTEKMLAVYTAQL